MIPSLPIAHIPLSKAKGAFKPCRWCEGTLGTFEAPKDTHPDFHAARVICEGCSRQIAWASASQVRKAAQLDGVLQ